MQVPVNAMTQLLRRVSVPEFADLYVSAGPLSARTQQLQGIWPARPSCIYRALYCTCKTHSASIFVYSANLLLPAATTAGRGRAQNLTKTPCPASPCQHPEFDFFAIMTTANKISILSPTESHIPQSFSPHHAHLQLSSVSHC